MKKKGLWTSAIALMLAVSLTACGSSASKYTADSAAGAAWNTVTNASAYDSGYFFDESPSVTAVAEDYMDYESAKSEYGMNSSAAGGDSQVTTGTYSQKLIRTYNFSYETMEFDNSIAFINQKVAEYGGYIESSETSGKTRRYARFTVRIPEKNAGAFLSEAGAIGELISKSESAEDVTLEYYDISSRIETLHTQHDRLIELLETAATLEDIVQLERELSDVEYELNSYQSRLRLYDNLVNYVTMYINIDEVTQIQVVEEDSFWTEVKKGLTKNTQNVIEGLLDAVVAVITAIPYIIVVTVILAVTVFVLVLINKHSKKRIAKKKEKMEISEQNGMDKQ